MLVLLAMRQPVSCLPSVHVSVLKSQVVKLESCLLRLPPPLEPLLQMMPPAELVAQTRPLPSVTLAALEPPEDAELLAEGGV